MRLIIQRVNKAKVTTVLDNMVSGEISKGLFILVGFGKEDTATEVNKMSTKIIKLRLMDDESGFMNRNIKDDGGEILVVSQFTLYGSVKDGNRPSFIKAMESEGARVLYKQFVENLKNEGIKVATGQFGQEMEIEAELDGPVTIMVSNEDK